MRSHVRLPPKKSDAVCRFTVVIASVTPNSFMTLDPASVLVQGSGFDSTHSALTQSGVGDVPTTYIDATHVRCAGTAAVGCRHKLCHCSLQRCNITTVISRRHRYCAPCLLTWLLMLVIAHEMPVLLFVFPDGIMPLRRSLWGSRHVAW